MFKWSIWDFVKGALVQIHENLKRSNTTQFPGTVRGWAIMARTTEDRLPCPHGLRYTHQISWLYFFQWDMSKKSHFSKSKKKFQKYLTLPIISFYEKMKLFKMIFIFLAKYYFLCQNMNFTCFQLSFEVYTSSVAKKYFLFHFLLKDFNFDLCCLHGQNLKTKLHRGLFWCLWKGNDLNFCMRDNFWSFEAI